MQETAKDDNVDITVAELLDAARQKIVDARQANREPRYLWVNTALYQRVAEAKEREIKFGNPLLLLGVEVVGSDTVPYGTVEVL